MSKTEVKYGNEIFHLDIENEVKKLVSRVFDEIVKSSSIEELNQVLRKFDSKYVMSDKKYPQIKFKITEDEIKTLNNSNLLSDDVMILLTNAENNQFNTLLKLLYSLAWKNGDLPKIKHIIKGILESENEAIDKEDGLVFYQFGRYLTKKNNEPIIDQHVLRAFAISGISEESLKTNTSSWQKMETINKSNKFLIDDYKKWLQGLPINLGKTENCSYEIDKILFALGKTIKHKPKSNK